MVRYGMSIWSIAGSGVTTCTQGTVMSTGPPSSSAAMSGGAMPTSTIGCWHGAVVVVKPWNRHVEPGEVVHVIGRHHVLEVVRQVVELGADVLVGGELDQVLGVGEAAVEVVVAEGVALDAHEIERLHRRLVH